MTKASRKQQALPPARVAAHVERRIAVEADADPRSVRRVLAGQSLRVGAVEERIKRAAAAANIEIPGAARP
jgi:hypothetical protein